MFMAALFINKVQKQPKCPSTDKWIKQNTVYHVTKYYSIITQESSTATTWMNLANIMLNERNQTQKTTYCMILFI